MTYKFTCITDLSFILLHSTHGSQQNVFLTHLHNLRYSIIHLFYLGGLNNISTLLKANSNVLNLEAFMTLYLPGSFDTYSTVPEVLDCTRLPLGTLNSPLTLPAVVRGTLFLEDLTTMTLPKVLNNRDTPNIGADFEKIKKNKEKLSHFTKYFSFGYNLI